MPSGARDPLTARAPTVASVVDRGAKWAQTMPQYGHGVVLLEP
jgi:hypothetical protein